MPDIDSAASSVSGISSTQSDLAFLNSALETNAAAAATPAETDTDVSDSIDSAIAEQDGAETEVETEPKSEDEVEKTEPEVETDPETADKVEPKPEDSTDDDFDTNSLTVNSLNTELKKNPEFKAMLDKNPGLRKQLFYSARMSARAGEYDGLFQTPALAKEAKAAADEHYQTRELFESAEPGSAEKFLTNLVQRSVLRDDQGRMRVNANGQPMTDGNYDRVMGTYRTNLYGAVGAIADNLLAQGHMVNGISGDDVKAAIAIFSTILGDGGNAQGAGKQTAAGQQTETENVPSHVQEELNRLRSENQQYKSKASQTVQDFTSTARAAGRDALVNDAKNLLAKRLPQNSAFSEYMKQAIVKDTVDELEKLSDSNMAYRSRMGQLYKTVTRDGEGTKRVVEAQRAHANELMPRILAKFLNKANEGVVSSNRSLHTKVGQQQKKVDVNASGGVKVAPTRPDAAQIARQVEAESRKTGKRVNEYDLVDQVVAAQKKR